MNNIHAHLDMRSFLGQAMEIRVSVLFVGLLIISAIPGCTSSDSQEDVATLEVQLDVVVGEDGENDSVNASAIVSGGESPYSYQWELDGSQMLSMNSYLKMSNLSEGEHIVSVSVSSNDGQVNQITAKFTIS